MHLSRVETRVFNMCFLNSVAFSNLKSQCEISQNYFYIILKHSLKINLPKFFMTKSFLVLSKLWAIDVYDFTKLSSLTFLVHKKRNIFQFQTLKTQNYAVNA